MKNKMLISFGSLFLLSCSTYMEQVVYKPAPATYQEWSKYGASSLDIKKSLLECGKPAPDTNYETYEKAFNISRHDELAYMNKLQIEDICLERAGYTYEGIYNTKKICALEKYRDLSACQPNAIIPTPSVQRRLNSWYCKIDSDYDYCLKHAINIKICNPERANNLPPECLTDRQTQSPASSAGVPAQRQQQRNTYTQPNRNQEHANQLQRNTQTQNNRQMNQVLKNSSPKTKR